MTNTAGAGSIQPPLPLDVARATPAVWYSSRDVMSYLRPYVPITALPSSDRTGNWRLCFSAIVSDVAGVWGENASSLEPRCVTTAGGSQYVVSMARQQG